MALPSKQRLLLSREQTDTAARSASADRNARSRGNSRADARVKHTACSHSYKEASGDYGAHETSCINASLYRR